MCPPFQQVSFHVSSLLDFEPSAVNPFHTVWHNMHIDIWPSDLDQVENMQFLKCYIIVNILRNNCMYGTKFRVLRSSTQYNVLYKCGFNIPTVTMATN